MGLFPEALNHEGQFMFLPLELIKLLSVWASPINRAMALLRFSRTRGIFDVLLFRTIVYGPVLVGECVLAGGQPPGCPKGNVVSGPLRPMLCGLVRRCLESLRYSS